MQVDGGFYIAFRAPTATKAQTGLPLPTVIFVEHFTPAQNTATHNTTQQNATHTQQNSTIANNTQHTTLQNITKKG